MAAKKVILIDPNYLDVIQRRQAIAGDPKLNIQIDLDREMEQILQSRTLNVYDKLKSYNAILQRYLQLADTAPVDASTSTTATQAAAAPVAASDPVIRLPTKEPEPVKATQPVQSDDQTGIQSRYENLLKRLPAAHRGEARRLLNALRLGEAEVQWDESGGNVRVANRHIQYANVISWLNYALKRRPSSAPPNAITSFARLLSKSGLDPLLVPNARLRQEIKAARHPTKPPEPSSAKRYTLTPKAGRVSKRRYSGIPVSLKRRRLNWEQLKV